jgi:hypothetical protein
LLSHPPLPPQSSDIGNSEKNCIFNLRRCPRPLSSCGGAISLLMRSNGREYIGEETAFLERLQSNNKWVSYHVFLFLNAKKFTTTSPIASQLLLNL